MWHIHSFESVGSTQDVARQYLAEEYPLPFAVLAAEQTAGRGRSGNMWMSPPKGNLYCSLGMETKSIPLKDAGQYSFLTAIALMETLSSIGIKEARNKWPNDILVDRKKIAGILLESDTSETGELRALIIGFGVNLKWAPEGAISAHDLLNKELQPREFLVSFLENLQKELISFSQEGFAPIRRKWLENAYGLGKEIHVRLPGQTFFGQFEGLDENGALLVRLPEGTEPKRIYSGEVFFHQKEN